MSRSRFSLSLASTLAITVLMLTGCSVTLKPVNRPVKEETFQAPEVPPALMADGSAADNLPFFHETLRLFALGEASVQGQVVVDSLAAAGFDKAKMQVSFDETKTNLVADNIFVSVLYGQDCLIGQVVVADRSFVTKVAPAVGPEINLCLIGNTRPIDW